MEEIWKDIEGYEGIYQVSNLGNVKRLPYRVKNRFGSCCRKEHYVGYKGKNGYMYVVLPKKIYNEDEDVAASLQITSGWEVLYTTYTDIFYYQMDAELIDALYMMVIKLKDKGLI